MQVDYDFRYQQMIGSILQWLIWKHPPQGEIDFLLSALAEAVAKIPQSELTGMETMNYSDIKVRALDRRRLTYLDNARRPFFADASFHPPLSVLCMCVQPQDCV